MAERIRAAEALLRELAYGAMPIPWDVTDGVVWTTDIEFDPSDPTGETAMQIQVKVAESDSGTARYIAMMSPPVALALADWLGQFAHDLNPDDWHNPTLKPFALADALLGGGDT